MTEENRQVELQSMIFQSRIYFASKEMSEFQESMVHIHFVNYLFRLTQFAMKTTSKSELDNFQAELGKHQAETKKLQKAYDAFLNDYNVCSLISFFFIIIRTSNLQALKSEAEAAKKDFTKYEREYIQLEEKKKHLKIKQKKLEKNKDKVCR